jgi:hypothetical protein
MTDNLFQGAEWNAPSGEPVVCSWTPSFLTPVPIAFNVRAQCIERPSIVKNWAFTEQDSRLKRTRANTSVPWTYEASLLMPGTGRYVISVSYALSSGYASPFATSLDARAARVDGKPVVWTAYRYTKPPGTPVPIP